MDKSEKSIAFDNSQPPCYIYEPSINKWRAFQTLILTLEDSNGNFIEFFRLNNPSTTSGITIHRRISYEYIVYYSKLIPSVVKSNSSSTASSATSSPLSQGNFDKLDCLLNSSEIQCITILEDLSLRYNSTITDNQYILLGFKVKNSTYEEDNTELKFIRKFIADLHWRLKYSDGGIIYQVTQRMQKVLYKTLKYSLSYICSLYNISPDISIAGKLEELHRMQHDPAFQDYLNVIIKNPAFTEEITSLAYKTIAMVGMFPAHVEINTMDERKIWLRIKNMFTNPINAPYGSQHHASFSLGNFRYSFIFEPGNKEKQRVSISSEVKRGFNLRNKAFDYFRIKFFDFFPMDSWVQAIAVKVLDLLPIYFNKTTDFIPEFFEDLSSLKDVIWSVVEEQEVVDGEKNVSEKIAREFYSRYMTKLDESSKGKPFRKMTQLISDAEVRGYSNLSNNCQTIVTEIISVFGKKLQNYIEPLFDLKRASNLQELPREEVLRDFLRFGSQFNLKFADVSPFPLTYRISYIDTFSDKDTCELLYPKNFGSLYENLKEYQLREDVQDFMGNLEDGLMTYAKIHRINSGESEKKEKVEYPEIDLKAGARYGKVSCLMTLAYNELFNIRREIKIAKYCEELVEHQSSQIEEIRCKMVKRRQMRKIKKLQMVTEKLPQLYQKKYKLIEAYKELCFYYFNTIRLGVKPKLGDNLSYLGFLLIRKPDDSVAKMREEERIEERLEDEIALQQKMYRDTFLSMDGGSEETFEEKTLSQLSHTSVISIKT